MYVFDVVNGFFTRTSYPTSGIQVRKHWLAPLGASVSPPGKQMGEWLGLLTCISHPVYIAARERREVLFPDVCKTLEDLERKRARSYFNIPPPIPRGSAGWLPSPGLHPVLGEQWELQSHLALMAFLYVCLPFGAIWTTPPSNHPFLAQIQLHLLWFEPWLVSLIYINAVPALSWEGGGWASPNPSVRAGCRRAINRCFAHTGVEGSRTLCSNTFEVSLFVFS